MSVSWQMKYSAVLMSATGRPSALIHVPVCMPMMTLAPITMLSLAVGPFSTTLQRSVA